MWKEWSGWGRGGGLIHERPQFLDREFSMKKYKCGVKEKKLKCPFSLVNLIYICLYCFSEISM